MLVGSGQTGVGEPDHHSAHAPALDDDVAAHEAHGCRGKGGAVDVSPRLVQGDDGTATEAAKGDGRVEVGGGPPSSRSVGGGGFRRHIACGLVLLAAGQVCDVTRGGNEHEDAEQGKCSHGDSEEGQCEAGSQGPDHPGTRRRWTRDARWVALRHPPPGRAGSPRPGRFPRSWGCGGRARSCGAGSSRGSRSCARSPRTRSPAPG
jgi:hypothetical protein